MAIYTQANRPMRVDTVLDPDVLLLDSMRGIEGISQPFSFHLDLLSEDKSMEPMALLRTPMVVTMNLHNGGKRFIHGLVSRFVQLGQKEELTAYRADIVPWSWFLSLSRESRIYQKLSVPDIIEKVIRDQGYSDFEFRCNQKHEPREYCVQYRESHLNFISRLMEEEGIFYFFEHTQDKHMLVITDHNGAMAPCPELSEVRFHSQAAPDEDVVRSIEHEMSAWVGTVTLRDYDFTHPSLSLESSLTGGGVEEVYDYPGRYLTLAEGERFARLQLEAEEAMRVQLRGAGSCRSFVSGGTFELQDYYRPEYNDEYILVRVQHVGHVGGYRSAEAAGGIDYHNDFVAIPADTVYRTPRRTPRPVIHGTQTALVVGPAGEEIYTDKFGRVKVQFYWDRVGKRNENSSCWVRVASPWAGKGYGNVTIPRINNEVVVHFLEGDPDRPLILGSVYNAEQAVPFELPGSGIQQGIKSRSSPGGGGHNEITVTDTKGKEKMTIHAQYDRSTKVGHDDTISVTNDRSMTVTGKLTETIKGNTTVTVQEGNHAFTVSSGKSDVTVKAGLTVKVTDGALTENAKTNVEITSDTAAIHLKAATEIKLSVGASTILMKSDGSIKINGKAVAIEGSQKVGIHGGEVSSKADGTNEIKGAMVLSDGAAKNTVKGGMVMLNP